jgi:hypothetical protein
LAGPLKRDPLASNQFCTFLSLLARPLFVVWLICLLPSVRNPNAGRISYMKNPSQVRDSPCFTLAVSSFLFIQALSLLFSGSENLPYQMVD